MNKTFNKVIGLIAFGVITFVTIFMQGEPIFETISSIGGISFLLYLIIETSLGGFKNNETKKEDKK